VGSPNGPDAKLETQVFFWSLIMITRAIVAQSKGVTMKKQGLFLMSLLCLAASSGISQDVRFSFNKQADFSSFKTYKWVAIEGTAPEGLSDGQIKATFDAELEKKGLTRVDSETADLFVGYQFGVRSEQEFAAFGGFAVGVPIGGTMPEDDSIIHKGELALDMYEVSKRTRAWRGIAEKTIDPDSKPKKRQKNLAKAINKLLKNYPP
jgi:hypothetical protein